MRGKPATPDGVVLILETNDVYNYYITPEPIRYEDWPLVVARLKPCMIQLRQADLSCDDLLLMICAKIDDLFYASTTDDGKKLLPELPGVQVRRGLIDQLNNVIGDHET